jgi:uncharacterized protein (UPF0276 family)
MDLLSDTTAPASDFALRPIPATSGVGLKHEHIRDVIAGMCKVAWFEIHAENYMGAGGPPHRILSAIRERFALSLHGVGLSIGSAGPLDKTHLNRLRLLIERYKPGLFSEHLAWSTHDGAYLNDLLPLPYTAETLDRVADHIDETQQTVGMRMLLENPSTYVRFPETTLSEVDFLAGLADRTGCGLLLDVNNVQVSASNHGYDPQAYIESFPLDLVGEIHLAGYDRVSDDDGGDLLIDTHDRAVLADVWALYRTAIRRGGPKPTLIEWDSAIPDWITLEAEAAKADAVMAERRTNAQPPAG